MVGLDATGIQQVLGLVKPAVLKMIGGVPILKNLSGSTLERLKLPKHLDVGNVGSLLQQVMQNGPGALLQNPLAAMQGQIAGIAAGAAGQLAGIAGAGGLVSAVGALSSSVGSLSALAGNLAGVTALPGLPDQSDLIGHMALASGFGDALPPGLGFDVVTAPITMAGSLGTMASQATGLIADVAAGRASIGDALAAVGAMQATVDGATNGATGAIAMLQAGAPAMAAAQAAVACLVPGAVPDAVAAAMRACIRPDQFDAVQAIVDAHVAEVTQAPPMVTAPG